jgi:hypothetical protein
MRQRGGSESISLLIRESEMSDRPFCRAFWGFCHVLMAWLIVHG